MATDTRDVTYDLTTDRGKVRLGLTDTRGDVFTDDEIDYFLEQGSVVRATIAGLNVLLVDAARRTRLYSAEGMSYNDTQQVAGIQAAIRELEKQSGYPEITIGFPALLPMDRDYDELNP